MAQLASPKQKSAPSTSKENSSQTSRLGYEILHRSRQSGRLTLPLSLPEKDKPGSSTGSALLDSFERDRLQPDSPLHNLHLIPIAPPSHFSELTSPRQGNQATSYPPVTVLLKTESKQAGTEQPKTKRPVTIQPEKKATETSRTETKYAEAKQPQPQRIQPKQPAPTSRNNIKHPEVKQNQPPAPIPSTVAPLATDPADQKIAPKKAKASGAGAPLLPIRRLSMPTGKKPASTVNTNSGKTARDSAAAVGLLDLNDSLLFGGDHEDLSCIDPFVSQEAVADPTGVLTYLSQQVSAFTVDRLSHNLPITTSIAVLNQKDEPKRATVLDLKTFRLKNLKPEAEAALTEDKTSTRTKKVDSHSNNTDVAELTQQLQALNRKVDYLSRKLQETSNG